MLAQPGAPDPQAPGTGSALAALRTMSTLLVFLGGTKKEGKVQVALRGLWLYPTDPFSSVSPPSEPSNPLSLHPHPLPVPVTGRPGGLFNVTRGPKTYIT